MKVSISIICGIVLISFSGLSLADEVVNTNVNTSVNANGNTGVNNIADPGINKRQRIQKNRVIGGVKSGELTRAETRRLVKQQRAINRLERSYKSDGHLTKRERVNLHRAQNRASRNIYRQKHNRQRP